MDTICRLLKEKNMLDLQHPSACNRPVACKATDIAALHTIIQAAINVEEFTIPLYMCSMYSLQGMHQITGKNSLYRGRLWPGMATVSKPNSANEVTFNQIFKVFIEEMLHLQMIANIAKVSGIEEPSFTSPELMDQQTYGWTCYGDDITVIPHIIDFQDMQSDQVDYGSLRVKLDALNKQQIEIFLAIESAAETSLEHIKPEALDKYFPTAPFKNWQPSEPLPMFGSIGWLYVCLWQYIELRYDDGSSLWESVYDGSKDALERDLFNNTKEKEYPGMRAKVNNLGIEDTPFSPEEAKAHLLNMISGITDQGEGKTVADIIREHIKNQSGLQAVSQNYQADFDHLEKRYPSRNDQGKTVASADAAARATAPNVSMDHLEIFSNIKKRLYSEDSEHQITTWEQWHQQGNTWTADTLKTDSYDDNRFNETLPSADDIAGALNRLKENDESGANYTLMSQSSAGAIKGITTVLDSYWSDKTVKFPFPSMAGSGDRMSICWAVFGKAPDMSIGTPSKTKHRLYHACQGLKLDPKLPNQPGGCGLVEVYHTCKGSNTCKGEGGCGFVQRVGGGSNCSHPRTTGSGEKQNDDLIYYSIPSDNKCAGQGGCAIPISASQLHLNPGKPKSDKDTQAMAAFNITKSDNPLLGYFPYGDSPYKEGALVHDVAWDAYIKVLKDNGQDIPKKPKPSDLRLAFPPST